MKIFVNEFPRTKEECLLKRICPNYEFCMDTNECNFLTLHSNSLIEDKKQMSTKEKVEKILLEELGARVDLKGFIYCSKTLAYLEEHNCDQSDKFTALLYDIAQELGTTYIRLERSLRHFIYSIIEIGSWDDIIRIFGKKYEIDFKGNIPLKEFCFGLLRYAQLKD